MRTVFIAIVAALSFVSADVMAITPRSLLQVSDLSSVDISPDGRSVVFREERASVEQNKYGSAWYIVNIETPAFALRVADGGAPLRNGAGLSISETPQWSGDSEWFYYRALIDQEVQVWRASRDGRHVDRVTSDAANVERFLFLPGSDGGAIIYQVGATREEIKRAEKAEYDQGILFDDTVVGQQNLFRSFPMNGRLASHRYYMGYKYSLLWNEPKKYYAVNLYSLEVREAASKELAAFSNQDAAPSGTRNIQAAAKSEDGKWTAILSRARHASSELRVFSAHPIRVAKSPITPPISCDACRNVEGFAWRDSDEIVFTARDSARGYAQALYAWNISNDAVRLISDSEGLLSSGRNPGGSTCAVSSRFAACISASALVPPRLERVDLDTGERSVLFDPNAGLTARAKEMKHEFLSWEDEVGNKFTGHLITPPSREPHPRLPLFITYYICSGFLRGGYGDEWPLLSLASGGVAALCVNQAISPIVGDAVADYDAGLRGVATIIDILNERGVIDSGQVGMGGLSFGSEVATWVAGKSNLLAAVSVANTQASAAWYWFQATDRDFQDRAMKRWGLGSPEQTPDQWRKLSPVFYADQIRAPFLMQLVEGEYRSNLEFYTRLVQSKVPTELYVFPNETHQKYEPRHKLAAYERNLDWFRFWLQGFEDPTIEKAEQYVRWRKMRDERCVWDDPEDEKPSYCIH